MEDEGIVVAMNARCAICCRTLDSDSDYPGRICDHCDKRAVNASGLEPSADSVSDSGDNPVYVDGWRCFRRHHLGGWVTMVDQCD